jgi:hypothetical protein
VVGLIQSHKEVEGEYIVELKPENSFGYYDMSINVIQGIASFENGWFTSQTSANKFLSINYLNEKGESEFNFRFDINSHGQDLSLEKVSDSVLYLYTTVGHYDKKGRSGILRLKVILPEKINGKRDMSKLVITLDGEFCMELDNSTPTLSEDKNQFAIRSGKSIIIASKQDVLNNDLSNAKKFDLDKSQIEDAEGNPVWFQGIAMKNNLVYCFTGDNLLNTPKLLYVYDTDGNIVEKHIIGKNEFANQLGEKLEPEGLVFMGDDLHYTIILKGKTGRNRKFLFKL